MQRGRGRVDVVRLPSASRVPGSAGRRPPPRVVRPVRRTRRAPGRTPGMGGARRTLGGCRRVRAVTTAEVPASPARAPRWGLGDALGGFFAALVATTVLAGGLLAIDP